MSKTSDISEVLLKRIRTNVYTNKIPGERALTAEFEVDFKTANRAVSLLVEQGTLVRKRGEGTFVAPINQRRAITLGLCFYKMTDPGRDPVFTRFFAGVNSAVKAHRVRVDVTALKDVAGSAAGSDAQLTARFQQEVLSANPDGLIFLGNVNAELIKVLQKDRPLLLVAEAPEELANHTVRRNVFSGAFDVVHRLAALGHRQIALATYQHGPDTYDLSAKEQGYAGAIKKLGLTPHVITLHGIPEEELVHEIKKLTPRPTALIAAESTLGLSVMKHGARLGLRLPQDLAVVSFDDGDLGAFTQPMMSSIHAFGESLAQVAVQRMIEWLDGMTTARIHEILPCEYVERESSAHAMR